MKSGFSVVLGLTAAVLLAAAPAHAAAGVKAYGNFGMKNTFDPNSAHYVIGPTSILVTESGFRPSWPAAPFMPTVTSSLAWIDLPITDNNAAFNANGYIGLVVSLTSDNGGKPGVTLESWTVTKLAQYVATKIKITKLTSKLAPHLVAGTQYWVVVQPLGLDTIGSWLQNNQGLGAGTVRTTPDGGTTWNVDGNHVGAFDVFVKPVPG